MTIPPFSRLLEEAKEPMDTLRDSLTVYHAFLHPVTVTSQELDSVVTAFVGYVQDIREHYLVPMDSASFTQKPTMERLTEIADELVAQQALLSKLTENVSLIISDVKAVQRQDNIIKVYTLDGRQKAMGEKPLSAQPKGLYISKGKKRIVK